MNFPSHMSMLTEFTPNNLGTTNGNRRGGSWCVSKRRLVIVSSISNANIWGGSYSLFINLDWEIRNLATATVATVRSTVRSTVVCPFRKLVLWVELTKFLRIVPQNNHPQCMFCTTVFNTVTAVWDETKLSKGSPGFCLICESLNLLKLIEFGE